MVNDFAFEAAARRPDPQRLVQAYHQSASTLNLLRAFTKGGFADLSRVHQWNLEFVATSREGRRYDQLAAEIDRALRFMAACGIELQTEAQLHAGRLLHVARGAAARLRGGADPARLAHRRLVRLQRAPRVARRAHPPARRRARALPVGRAEPGRGEARARRPRPKTRSSSAAASTPAASRAGSRS